MMKKTLLLIVISLLLCVAVFASDELPLSIQAQVGYGYHNRGEQAVGQNGGDPVYTFATMGPVIDLSIGYDVTDQLTTELGFAYQISLQKQAFQVGESQEWKKVDRKLGTCDSYAVKLGLAFGFNLGEGNTLKLRAGGQMDLENATLEKEKVTAFGAYVGVTEEVFFSDDFGFVAGAEGFYGFAKSDSELKVGVNSSILSFNGKAGVVYQF